MRVLFYISTPIVCFLALMFFATIGGETTDGSAVAGAVAMFGAFAFALQNMVRERKLNDTPFAKIYFAAWIYSFLLFAGTVLAYFLGFYHPV